MLTPAAAYCAGHEAGHVPSIADLGRYWINFLIFVYILYAALKKPAPAAWQQRRLQLQQEVARGQAELASARMRIEQAENNMRLSDLHVQDLQKSTERETVNERTELGAETGRRAEALMAQAKRTAAAEREAAARAVRDELVDAVMRKAAERIRGELTPDRDGAIRRSVADGVGILVQ